MSIVDTFENAEEVKYDPADDIAIAEAALEVVKDDLKAGLSKKVLQALGRLDRNGIADYFELRRRFKKANPDISLTWLDRKVKINTVAQDTTIKTDPVNDIVEYFESVGTLFYDQDNDAYIHLTRDEHKEVLPIESREFTERISYENRSRFNRILRRNNAVEAVLTLAGKARNEGELKEVHLRVAPDPDGNGYWIDLCDDKWRAIHVTAKRWTIRYNPTVLFRRNAGMLPIPLPVKGGSVEDLMQLGNIKHDDIELYVATLIECFRPDTDYPIVELGGEQGSAKSTTARNLHNIIDPSTVPLRSHPKTAEDVAVAAHNNYMVAYDNLSRLPSSMQDTLCGLSTGSGYAARKFYTNTEEASFNTKRPVIMTGLEQLATHSDLLSRTVRLVCPTLDDKKRKDGLVMQATFEAHAPKALGFLFDTFSNALALLPIIKLTRKPRLADFIRLGEAVAQSLGRDAGFFTNHYMMRSAEAHVLAPV